MSAVKIAMPRTSFPADDLPQRRPTFRAGLLVIALGLGGVFGWTVFARLDSAVMRQGAMVVDSRRKPVQHLEGGIVDELLVKDGDRVVAGQPLARLATAQIDAQLAQLDSQRIATDVKLARLTAEEGGSRRLAFPSDLEARRDEPYVGQTLEQQRRHFIARWQARDGTIAVLERNIAESREAIVAAEAQRAAGTAKRRSFQKELTTVQHLVAKGLERGARQAELERAVASIDGDLAELSSSMRQLEERIAAAKLEIENVDHQRLADIGRELELTSSVSAELSERMLGARDIQSRSLILAPQDGVVVGLRLATRGGVLAPGEPLMEIVPVDDELIIETRLLPTDIDSVHPGLPARVRLSAYRRAVAPEVTASVTYVSADMLQDERTGDPFFVARLKIDPGELAHLPGVTLSPGMPVDVMITTGERHAIDYLAAPLLDRFRRAGREE